MPPRSAELDPALLDIAKRIVDYHDHDGGTSVPCWVYVYDPKDEFTAHSVGRLPRTSYLEATNARSLAGLRIGVVREYLNRKLLTQADMESVDLIERAIGALRKLGATVVDPGPDGALFQRCIARSAPELLSSAFLRQNKQLFSAPSAQPSADQIATFVELPADVHPYYVATQAHPELRSRPTRAHPLFSGLIEAAIQRQRELLIPIDESALRRRWDADEETPAGVEA